jgi:hypothetical protein
MDSEEKDPPDWGGAIQSAISEAGDDEDDDGPGINVVSSSGLTGTAASAPADREELPYVTLLKAAVAMVQTGEITVEEYVEGINKLDAIADNALKVYAIPAVKKDLPGKLTGHQNAIVNALEVEIHRLKEGIATLLAYPASQAVGDLETGLEQSVNALNAMADIQAKADTERAAILQREKEEKARRAQKAADEDEDEDS